MTKIRDIKQFKKNGIYIHKSKQFKTINIMKITKAADEDVLGRGIIKGIFVKPQNI